MYVWYYQHVQYTKYEIHFHLKHTLLLIIHLYMINMTSYCIY